MSYLRRKPLSVVLDEDDKAPKGMLPLMIVVRKHVVVLLGIGHFVGDCSLSDNK